MPAVSVIIPVYNVEPYLRECLDSVVNQTLRDLEIICVNDGSTDGSPAILEEYAAKDSRIKIVNKVNGGLNSARNAGLDRVTGEYFAFVDSDDWLDVTTYEKAYARAKKSNADMTQFNFSYVGFPDVRDIPIPDVDEVSVQADKIHLLFNNCFVCCCNLWKTEFVKKNHLRFHEDLFLYGDDIPFTFKTAILANKMAVLPKRMYFYRYRPNSNTNNKTSKRLLDSWRSFTLLFEDIRDSELSDESRILLYKTKWGVLSFIYNNRIDKSFHSKMRKRIGQNVTNEERQFMMANRRAFDDSLFSFFVNCSGSFKVRCKYYKGCIFDNIVKRLIPYSPWLQRTVEIVDMQRTQIEDLQNQIKEKNSRNDNIAD
ncbi:MAG: glycosyltransferase [Thermoguttaceae bacterium]|nr:glycosyltransferase [Thermoguttaceae bacterium]